MQKLHDADGDLTWSLWSAQPNLSGHSFQRLTNLRSIDDKISSADSTRYTNH